MKREKIAAPSTRKNSFVLPISLALFLLTVVFYTPIFSAGFINHDDPDYVTENPVVQAGFHGEGVRWAFTSRHASNWHPVTWLSHMMDCQLFGLNPKGHHATSLVIHALNAVLLFLLLFRMTNGRWQSALVAGFFALHPAHVESVAWISERKDVLSTFFGLAALWFYVRYAKASGEGNGRTQSYILTFVFFALSLMSKPMLVTFPFVLLLLDLWPLQRIKIGSSETGRVAALSFGRLMIEKLPFFLVAFVDCFITIWAQGEAVAKVDVLPLGTRVVNMLVSYLRYAGKLVMPADLALPYPYRVQLPIWEIAGAIVFLAGMTVFAVWLVRKKVFAPAVWWFWFIGTLVPVIGLVQVGQQAMADRYTYIPSIGFFLLVVWGLPELAKRFRIAPVVSATFSIGALGVFGILTARQAGYWESSATLFAHSVKVTRNNYLAHNFLGMALYDEDREKAFEHFSEAVHINSNYAEAHNNLGTLLMEMKRPEEAFQHFTKAVELKPAHALSQNNLGLALLQRGEIDGAISHFEAALRLKPAYVDACYFLGMAMRQKNNLVEARKYLSKALELQPSFGPAHRSLGQIYYGEGEFAEAAAHFRKLVELNPQDANAQSALADALSKAR